MQTFSTSLIFSGLRLIRWDPPTVGRAVCFPQCTDSVVISCHLAPYLGTLSYPSWVDINTYIIWYLYSPYYQMPVEMTSCAKVFLEQGLANFSAKGQIDVSGFAGLCDNDLTAMAEKSSHRRCINVWAWLLSRRMLQHQVVGRVWVPGCGLQIPASARQRNPAQVP